MKAYKFTLEKYHGPSTKHTCPQCGQAKVFTRYIDTDTGAYLADHIGRCDRESNCGYHLRPSEYFKANPQSGVHDRPLRGQSQPDKILSVPKPVIQKITRIESSYLNSSLGSYDKNNLIQFMARRFSRANAEEVINRYLIGTDTLFSKFGGGAAIFWQIDESGAIRAGKIMQYNPESGHRIKSGAAGTNQISWVHSELQRTGKIPRDGFQLQQCLFGLHLIREDFTSPVGIVESEKTAIIASLYFPELIWLACGSLNNIKEEILKPLKGRRIILFPDLKGYEKWQQKAQTLPGFNIKVSDHLEKSATDQERASGLDLADYLLSIPQTPDFESPPSNKREDSGGCVSKSTDNPSPTQRADNSETTAYWSDSPRPSRALRLPADRHGEILPAADPNQNMVAERSRSQITESNFLEGIEFGHNWFEIYETLESTPKYALHSTLANLHEYHRRLNHLFHQKIPAKVLPRPDIPYPAA